MVAATDKDLILQKTILRLEPAPVFTIQVDKGKGRLFDLDLNVLMGANAVAAGGENKLMASAIRAHRDIQPRQWESSFPEKHNSMKDNISSLSVRSSPGPSVRRDQQKRRSSSFDLQGNPMEHGFNLSVQKPYGVTKKKPTPRRRPHVCKRQANKTSSSTILQELYGEGGSGVVA